MEDKTAHKTPQHGRTYLGDGAAGGGVQVVEQLVLVDPHAARGDAHPAAHPPRRARLRHRQPVNLGQQ